MTPELGAEVWRIVREHLTPEDRSALADQVVGMMYDQGIDLDDIRYELSDDRDIISAVKYYADEDVDDEYQEELDVDDWDWDEDN